MSVSNKALWPVEIVKFWVPNMRSSSSVAKGAGGDCAQ